MLSLALGLALLTGPTVRQLVDDAQRAYARKDYLEAARLLESASKLDPSGRILFNLARAWEKANESEKAIVAYESYLDRPDAELQGMKRARMALATLYRLRPAPPEPRPPPEPRAEPLPPPAPPVEAPAPKVEPAPAVVVTLPEPPAPRAHPLRTVSLVTAMAGVTAGGVATGFGLWAQSTASLARASVDPMQKPLLVASTLQRATVTDVLWVACAAALATAAITFLVDLLAP